MVLPGLVTEDVLYSGLLENNLKSKDMENKENAESHLRTTNGEMRLVSDEYRIIDAPNPQWTLKIHRDGSFEFNPELVKSFVKAFKGELDKQNNE